MSNDEPWTADSTPPVPNPRDLAIDKARHFLGVERADLAQAELEAALSQDPEDVEALRLMSAVHLTQRKKVEALDAIEAALALEADDPWSHAMRGQVLVTLGRNREAEEALLRSLELNPVDPVTYWRYGLLMHKTGHLDKALRLARRGLELDPEDADLHTLEAHLLVEQKRVAEASASSGHGLRLAPDDATSHAAEARRLYHAGHPLKARAAMREAVRLDPSDVDYQEAFLELDRFCRPVGLPSFWLNRVMERIPGSWFGLWALFVGFLMFGDRLGIPDPITGSVVIGYLVLVVYSWTASPIMNLWVRVFPPRF